MRWILTTHILHIPLHIWWFQGSIHLSQVLIDKLSNSAAENVASSITKVMHQITCNVEWHSTDWNNVDRFIKILQSNRVSDMLRHQCGEIEDNLQPIYRMPQVSVHVRICSLSGEYKVISAFVICRKSCQALI